MVELSVICDYVKDKVEVSSLTRNNYISTENMLPNKEGIVDAMSVPALSQTQKYKKGDVLLSNIRPYFKKIWFAQGDGGCSNDVLVFRAKAGIEPMFLYYVLSNDDFFQYSMATSKGTKMPRGDKTAIMQYMVPEFNRETQKKIAMLLGSLDAKITLNKEINDNLPYAMSQAKRRRYQLLGACSRKAEYRQRFIGRMPDSSQFCCERSLAS